MATDSNDTYLRLGDGTLWPNPLDPKDVQWSLRYASPSREELLLAADMLSAYRHLATHPSGTECALGKLRLLRRATNDAAGKRAQKAEGKG